MRACRVRDDRGLSRRADDSALQLGPDQVEKATIEDQNFNYPYEDADGFHFMNCLLYTSRCV